MTEFPGLKGRLRCRVNVDPFKTHNCAVDAADCLVLGAEEKGGKKE